jgi:hypothetical protein
MSLWSSLTGKRPKYEVSSVIFKPFFALGVPRERASSAALDVRNGRADRKSRNTFHTARHDLRTVRSRKSEHSLLAARGQGSPSSSAEFLTSMTSQLFGMRPSLRFG